MRYPTRSALVAITTGMLLGSGAALAESLACKADLTGNGVVNFGDLAVLKAVFFETCNDPGPRCGDGIVQAPEQCDDNNLANGDGCSATCTIEAPLAVVCGNGIAQGPTETCDDGNRANSDGCSSACQIELPIVAVCADGFAVAPEQCDDGNLRNGDGCSATCTIEGPLPLVCGDGLAVTPEQCDDGNRVSGDGCSRTCMLEPARHFPATGQTTCWDTAGAVIPSCTVCWSTPGGLIKCGPNGHDGQIQAGATLAYVDNGDGTITDSNTGLMWEKLDDNNVDDIHDYSRSYSWNTAFGKIDALNAGGGFAGHTDWRLPNKKELQSIVNLENVSPAVSPAFNTACSPGCTSTSCSCTQSFAYWSSSGYADIPDLAWGVYFGAGYSGAFNKTTLACVRAVRGGL